MHLTLDDVPLISIIIPVYNSQEYIGICLESVLNQTYNNIEVILINDGSTDETLVICDEFSKKDQRVVVISQPNQGVSVARNVGLSVSNGKYICFVDGDDFIASNYIETLYFETIYNDSEMTICASFVFSDDSYLQKMSHVKRGSKVVSAESAFELVLNNHKYNTSVWGKLFCLDIIRKKPTIYFEIGLTIGEDLVWLADYFCRCQKVVVNDTQMYGYRQTGNSAMTSRKTSKKVLDSYYSQVQAIFKILNCCGEDGNIVNTLRARAFVYTIQAGYFLDRGSELKELIHSQRNNIYSFLTSQFRVKKIWLYVFVCLFTNTYTQKIYKKIY